MAEMPEKDELVLATIKKIMPYGAFCTLDEYDKREAFVHISEVAPRWIKNIHEFLHEGQKVVARVFRLNTEKNQVDLSIKRVTEVEKKRKLESIKREKRAKKLLEVTVKEAAVSPVDATRIKTKLLEKYAELYDAFEAVSEEGQEALKGLGLGKEFAEKLEEVAKKNVKKAKAEVRGIMSLACYEAEGVEVIKGAIGKPKMGKDTEISTTYLGAPKYQVKIVAKDYKTAEKGLDEFVEKVEKGLKGHSYSLSFERMKA